MREGDDGDRRDGREEEEDRIMPHDGSSKTIFLLLAPFFSSSTI